jgi:hypothetical protein
MCPSTQHSPTGRDAGTRVGPVADNLALVGAAYVEIDNARQPAGVTAPDTVEVVMVLERDGYGVIALQQWSRY